MRLSLSVAAAGLALVAMISPARSASVDQSTVSPDELRRELDACVSGKEAELQVTACTATLSTPGITPQKSAAILLMRAIAYRHLGDTNKALADLDMAIARRPDLMLAYANRAELRESKRNHQGAAEDYGFLIAHVTPTPELLDAYGSSLDFAQQHDKAIAVFSRAVDLAPSGTFKARYLIDRGAAHLYERKLDDVAADYAAAVQADPASSAAHFALGRVVYLRGDYPGATADFMSALATADGTDKIYVAIWLYLAAQYQGDAALAAARSATSDVDVAPWPGPVLAALRGDLSPDAITVPTDPGFGTGGPTCELHFYLGEQALAKGDQKAATDYFSKAIGTGVSEYLEFALAQIELERLNH